MNIHMIWAQDSNNAIGKNGTLPWHFSEDLKNFKKLTTGHTIIMGRKTWDSLPVKPLSNRRNIVISTQQQPRVESYTSIDNCMDALRDNNQMDIFIIGGMSIYNFFYKYANILHITFINKKYSNTDTFFPIGLEKIKLDFDLIQEQMINDQIRFTKWIRR